MKFIILAIAFLGLLSLQASAATCKKYGPQGQVIYYACHESEPVYSPKWIVTTTRQGATVVKKEIKSESICYNYAPGTIAYRGCRSTAKKQFEQKCETLTNQYRNTGSRDYLISVVLQPVSDIT